MEYQCGDIGESGVGTVFYVSATPFACGANMGSMCNYLESAPALWAPDSQDSCMDISKYGCSGGDQNTSDVSFSGKGITWCTGSAKKSKISGAQATVIGSGYANTIAIVAVCSSGDAASAARRYEGGGKTDWSLPSISELNALYKYPNRDAIGGFNSGKYWSSNTFNDVDFQNGNMKYETCCLSLGVRAIRAF